MVYLTYSLIEWIHSAKQKTFPTRRSVKHINQRGSIKLAIDEAHRISLHVIQTDTHLILINAERVALHPAGPSATIAQKSNPTLQQKSNKMQTPRLFSFTPPTPAASPPAT
jgi:hypothetical protein